MVVGGTVGPKPIAKTGMESTRNQDENNDRVIARIGKHIIADASPFWLQMERRDAYMTFHGYGALCLRKNEILLKEDLRIIKF